MHIWEGGSQKVTSDDKGEGVVMIPLKNDDVIYEQPLRPIVWIWRGSPPTAVSISTAELFRLCRHSCLRGVPHICHKNIYDGHGVN